MKYSPERREAILRKLLPVGQTMIATDITSPFFTPLKLALVLSVFVAIPYILFQIWSFIAPGLYAHEERLAFPLLFTAVALFYAGAMFVFGIIFGRLAYREADVAKEKRQESE